MSSQLSVCLLTRDEERNIERAIRSVAGVADEVVVADAGSTDRTAEIARGLGADVVPFSWDDDFSAGRNFALGHAKGDWVLWLNPDEELSASASDEVRSLLDGDRRDFGHAVRVQSIPRADRPDQFSETNDLRLFRREPGVRYVGRLHPGLAPELAKALEAEGRQVGASGVVIRHHAYMSALDESKLRWAVRLLERELADRPDQLHYQVEYGRSLLMLEDPRGHEVMAAAIGRIMPALGDPAPPGPDVQVLLEYALTTPPPANRGRIPAELAADLVRRWFPGSPPLLWAMAESSFRAGRFDAAAAFLERLLHLGAGGTYDRSRPFDPRIVGPWALLNLGHCRRALGSPEEARACYRPLLDDPDFAAQAARSIEEVDAATGAGRAGA